ncbi:MAG: hypothetical protein RSC10_06590, partial [Longicatena sp.]
STFWTTEKICYICFNVHYRKEKGKMEYKLLDTIFKNTQFNYLSDLNNSQNLKIIEPFIRTLHEDDFTIEDWIEACQYIVHKKDIHVETAKEAKELFLSYCESIKKQ